MIEDVSIVRGNDEEFLVDFDGSCYEVGLPWKIHHPNVPDHFPVSNSIEVTAEAIMCNTRLGIVEAVSDCKGPDDVRSLLIVITSLIME